MNIVPAVYQRLAKNDYDSLGLSSLGQQDGVTVLSIRRLAADEEPAGARMTFTAQIDDSIASAESTGTPIAPSPGRRAVSPALE